jgi:hypothetical protein
VHGIADRDGAIVLHVELRAARQLAGETRQQRLNAVDHLHGIGGWLAIDAKDDRAGPVVPACGLVVLDRVRHHRKIAEPHRPVAARRHDDVAELLGVGQLGLRHDGQGLLRVLQRADRRVGVGGRDRRLHHVDADAAGRERVRIQLHPHGIFLTAEDLHLRDAVDGRQRRRDHLLGERIQLRQRRNGAAQCQDQDRRVRRIHLAEARRLAHLVGQLPLHPRDRRLNVGGGAVDVAIEVELQRDGDRALLAR